MLIVMTIIVKNKHIKQETTVITMINNHPQPQ